MKHVALTHEQLDSGAMVLPPCVSQCPSNCIESRILVRLLRTLKKGGQIGLVSSEFFKNMPNLQENHTDPPKVTEEPPQVPSTSQPQSAQASKKASEPPKPATKPQKAATKTPKVVSANASKVLNGTKKTQQPPKPKAPSVTLGTSKDTDSSTRNGKKKSIGNRHATPAGPEKSPSPISSEVSKILQSLKSVTPVRPNLSNPASTSGPSTVTPSQALPSTNSTPAAPSTSNPRSSIDLPSSSSERELPDDDIMIVEAEPSPAPRPFMPNAYFAGGVPKSLPSTSTPVTNTSAPNGKTPISATNNSVQNGKTPVSGTSNSTPSLKAPLSVPQTSTPKEPTPSSTATPAAKNAEKVTVGSRTFTSAEQIEEITTRALKMVNAVQNTTTNNGTPKSRQRPSTSTPAAVPPKKRKANDAGSSNVLLPSKTATPSAQSGTPASVTPMTASTPPVQVDTFHLFSHVTKYYAYRVTPSLQIPSLPDHLKPRLRSTQTDLNLKNIRFAFVRSGDRFNFVIELVNFKEDENDKQRAENVKLMQRGQESVTLKYTDTHLSCQLLFFDDFIKMWNYRDFKLVKHKLCNIGEVQLRSMGAHIFFAVVCCDKKGLKTITPVIVVDPLRINHKCEIVFEPDLITIDDD